MFAVLAGSVEYHGREEKPVWWAHFDRLSAPPDQWISSSEVVLADEVWCTANWELPAGRRAARRELTVAGALPEGSILRPGLRIGLLFCYQPAWFTGVSTVHRVWT